MKRLTVMDRYWDGEAFWYDVMEPDVEQIDLVYNRLAAIEDIIGEDYDLDRLKELVQADREGRCEVIPREEFFLRLNSNIYVIDDGEVLEVLLYIIGRDQNGIGFIDVVYLPRHENEKRLRFRFSDVGKTVFLTSEEAEAALEKMKGGNE